MYMSLGYCTHEMSAHFLNVQQAVLTRSQTPISRKEESQEEVQVKCKVAQSLSIKVNQDNMH